MTDYHRDGNCHPDHCKECDWALANMREDHERNVCDGYPRCLFCEQEHNCDITTEAKCPSCRVMA